MFNTGLRLSVAVFLAIAGFGAFSGVGNVALAATSITASCPNQQTVQTVPAGTRVTVTTTATSFDSSEYAEGEPLLTYFNGVLIDTNNYDSTTHTITFVTATAGTVTACINFYDNDETGTVTVSIVPVTAEACKNDGYKAFGVFKTQGDCVSFVATGGKNLPANP